MWEGRGGVKGWKGGLHNRVYSLKVYLHIGRHGMAELRHRTKPSEMD